VVAFSFGFIDQLIRSRGPVRENVASWFAVVKYIGSEMQQELYNVAFEALSEIAIILPRRITSKL
jgi:hypothetical protein